MRPPGMLPVTALLAVLAAATSGAFSARAGDAPPLRLTIAFTGDVSGYLEPCG